MRGYHVHRAIWDVATGEELVCEREPSNEHDRYAVTVKLSSDICLEQYLHMKVNLYLLLAQHMNIPL